MSGMKTIGLLIERERAWGRILCEGVAAYAQERGDWALRMLEREDLRHPARLSSFDGFIARVADDEIAGRFAAAGRPVADLSCERRNDGMFLRGVLQDNLAVGRLAARHFIEHRFSNFAFCGYDGKRFSDERRDAFVRCLKLNRFACACYVTPRAAVRSFEKSVSRHEELAPGADAERLRGWLRKLPRPCAVFCANDLRSYQVLLACEASALKVPRDVAILGVDNDSLICNFTTPTLSSIDPDAFGLGRAAADCLDRKLSDPTAGEVKPRKIAPKGLVARASSETYPLDPPWLSDALVYIRRNVVRHISAADVYAHLGRSHTRVNRIFRERLGSTVQKEIRSAQLAEAERLLKTTALPLAEIARRSGFASPQYFCNIYSAAFGKPPSAAR